MIGCAVCTSVAMLCKETGITAIVSKKIPLCISPQERCSRDSFYFQGICAIHDIVVANKIRPIDAIKRLSFQRSYANLRSFWKLYKSTVSRLVTLLLLATILLSLRFSVMGFTTPTFQPSDNPASFVDNAFLRVLNYNYIYCLNAWLLVCPVWLCFDWSMGCIPLITGYDHRILAVAIFWSTLGTLIGYALSCQGRDETRR